MITAEATDNAVRLIDGGLDTMSARSLVPTVEIMDLLLDLRSLLVDDDRIGTSLV